MKILAYFLILVFILGVVGSFHFWPSDKDQRQTAFFSVLQFVAAFALILLTFLYVKTTQDNLQETRRQLADQNREPRIIVTRHWYPQTSPFIASLVIEAANPSARATSIAIKQVRIGEETARDCSFEVDRRRVDRLAIPARDICEVVVKAEFEGIPILSGAKQAALTFEDIFHGILAPVEHQL